MAFFSCTVNEIGPAADGTETADPVIYIKLTDTGGSFVNQWFYAAEKSKAQMLSVGLAALSTNRQVEVAINTPNVPYSSVTRMYLAAGGGTKLAFNQSFIGMPTSGKSLDPIDISSSISFPARAVSSLPDIFWMISRWMLEAAISPAPMM